VNSIFAKLRSFVGLDESWEEEYEYEEDGYGYQHPDQEKYPPHHAARTASTANVEVELASNVVHLPPKNGIYEVAIIKPHSFEEMPQVIQALWERKSVILNVTMMQPQEAQRSVDFISGSTYAIKGYQERLGDRVFLFAPSCVQVTVHSNTYEVPEPQTSFSHQESATSVWTQQLAQTA